MWATAQPLRPVAETGPPDFYLYLVGRLSPGATVEQSASALTYYLESNLAAPPMLLRGLLDFLEAPLTLRSTAPPDRPRPRSPPSQLRIVPNSA